MKKPYVIAEVGVNFYDTAKAEGISPMDAAKKYIKEASLSGVDAVKFQSYKADTIVSKNSPAYWDITKEPTKTQHELFKKHDSFGEKEYQELCDYCKQCNVDFLSTPFDYTSVDYLDKMVKYFKISSSDLSNLPFLKYIASKKKPIFLSVGASYISEIEEAVRTIREAGVNEICLFHCVLSYPTKNADANLSVIKTLKRIFPDIEIGYSDHTLPDETMTILSTAYLLGANIIEKHFTLDKTLKGNDHYHAGDPSDFKKAINNFQLINTVMGNDEKTVLECENVPRREARRSLVLTKEMKKNQVITENDVVAKRPGTGVPAKFFDIVVGKTVNKDLPEDSILQWSDI